MEGKARLREGNGKERGKARKRKERKIEMNKKEKMQPTNPPENIYKKEGMELS